MEIRLLPQISVWRLSPAERALGRALSISVPREPEHPGERDLVGDCFFGLFKTVPQLQAPTPPERAINAALFQWVQGLPGWEQTRAYTVLNLPAALSSAGLFWGLLTSEQAIQEALRKQEEAARAIQEARAQEIAADWLDSIGDQQASNAARQAAAGLQQQGLQALEEAQAIMEEFAGSPEGRAAAARAVARSRATAQKISQSMAGWGLGPGSEVHIDPQEAMDFLRHLSDKIRKIAELAGRLRGIALQCRRERVTTGIVPADVGFSQDLLRVFPTEVAFLREDAPPIIRARQAARWAESGLLGWVLRGDAKKRGPFVAAVDVSGSMAGEREIVAKALALGTAQVAKAEGRPYLLFSFGWESDPIRAVSSREGWKAHIQWASYAAHGGTSFNIALARAMEFLHSLGVKETQGADLLFISDGEAKIDPKVSGKWEGFRKTTGARLLFVPVAHHYQSYGDIERLADMIIPVRELDQREGETLSREVARWMR